MDTKIKKAARDVLDTFRTDPSGFDLEALARGQAQNLRIMDISGQQAVVLGAEILEETIALLIPDFENLLKVSGVEVWQAARDFFRTRGMKNDAAIGKYSSLLLTVRKKRAEKEQSEKGTQDTETRWMSPKAVRHANKGVIGMDGPPRRRKDIYD